MTSEQKLIELAKIDGWQVCQGCVDAGYIPSWIPPGKEKCVPDITTSYITSYDAIIPLIQKTYLTPEQWNILVRYIGGGGFSIMSANYKIMLKATPCKLSDALLKAKGFDV